MPASNNPNGLATVMPGAGTSFAVQEAEMGANQIGTSAVKVGFLQAIKVQVPTAAVLALFATPFQLIAAPAAGQSIVLHGFMIRTLPGTVQFASGGVVAPQYANTVHGGGTLITSTLPATTVNSASSSDTKLDDTGSNLTIPTGTGVFLSNATGAFTNGNGALECFLWYSIVDAN